MTVSQIMHWLEAVKDPEIPVLSLVDMGVITKVELGEADQVTVTMTPTFAGCPAMDYMKRDVEQVLRQHGLQNVTVLVNFDEPWTSNRLTEKGKSALKSFGLAPPPHLQEGIFDLEILEHVPCPYCNSSNTDLKTPFGPTLCRSMHYCNNCRQMFEQFKPL